MVYPPFTSDPHQVKNRRGLVVSSHSISGHDTGLGVISVCPTGQTWTRADTRGPICCMICKGSRARFSRTSHIVRHGIFDDGFAESHGCLSE